MEVTLHPVGSEGELRPGGRRLSVTVQSAQGTTVTDSQKAPGSSSRPHMQGENMDARRGRWGRRSLWAAPCSKEGGKCLAYVLEWLPQDGASTDHRSPGEGAPRLSNNENNKSQTKLNAMVKTPPGEPSGCREMCGPGLGELIKFTGPGPVAR